MNEEHITTFLTLKGLLFFDLLQQDVIFYHTIQ